MSASNVAKIESHALALDERQLIDVLRNSLYPGAKEESVRLVLDYCRAAKLDPLQKPVHIVPMSVSTGRKDSKGWDIKEMRDVIMPGVGLYRTQASRTGAYAGISDPEYGEDVTATMDNVDVTYPRWCRITVDKIVGGLVCRFSAKELWLENYATKSNSSTAPNATWRRRPYGQIAKCAEAQALRKAFPDNVGSAPTAEEMEGKEYGETVDQSTGEILTGKPQVRLPQSKSRAQEQVEQAQSNAQAQAIYQKPVDEDARAPEKSAEREPVTLEHDEGNDEGGVLYASEGERKYIINKAAAFDMNLQDLMAACKLSGPFEKLTADGFREMKRYFAEKARG